MIRRMFLGALATCALLLVNVDARATYSYTTGTVTATGTFAGVNPSNVPVTTLIPDDNPRTNQTLVTVTYSPITVQSVTTETLTWFETFNSNTTGQSQSFTVVAVLTLNSNGTTVTESGQTVTITPIPGGTGGFALTFANYNVVATGAAIGSPANLAFNFSAPSAVPEPASLVMLGGGMVGVLGVSLRRMRKKRKVETDLLSTS